MLWLDMSNDPERRGFATRMAQRCARERETLRTMAGGTAAEYQRLRELALAYHHHPDYRDDWRPPNTRGWPPEH